jgi:hypothetical protein
LYWIRLRIDGSGGRRLSLKLKLKFIFKIIGAWESISERQFWRR